VFDYSKKKKKTENRFLGRRVSSKRQVQSTPAFGESEVPRHAQVKGRKKNLRTEAPA